MPSSTRAHSSGIPLAINVLLFALACRSAPPPPPTPQISRESLVGGWRLDSLAVYALNDSISDSTRQVLSGYRTTIRRANDEMRTGGVRMITRYLADSTFEHVVTPADTLQPSVQQKGRWAFDAEERRITCRDEKEGPCPHDRAIVERVTARTLELRLELPGKAEGIGEYFRLRREP
ncbi:MAG TPA: hypothetical protein VJ596_02390 [Gemmatimonadaceae bacterium]|nr:hypothetical protein [Gemmatimonadaceae bacterium]